MDRLPRLELVEHADSRLEHAVLAGLRAFNRALFPNQPENRPLAIALYDKGQDDPVGGLIGSTAGGWLAIELIFVPETLRGQGLAKRLIHMAEDEARRRGCHAAWLDTVNPSAAALYERMGYARFGALKDYPLGNSRLFLQKKL